MLNCYRCHYGGWRNDIFCILPPSLSLSLPLFLSLSRSLCLPLPLSLSLLLAVLVSFKHSWLSSWMESSLCLLHSLSQLPLPLPFNFKVISTYLCSFFFIVTDFSLSLSHTLTHTHTHTHTHTLNVTCDYITAC